jgi:hypothetical protein
MTTPRNWEITERIIVTTIPLRMSGAKRFPGTAEKLNVLRKCCIGFTGVNPFTPRARHETTRDFQLRQQTAADD